MTYNDVRKNENKGFSLVELIVVIAIMAVLVAVLAPSLLQYVERSRAQKDDSAMGEVANAVMLALADQDVYDEVLAYTCSDNYSCYVDSDSLDDHADNKEFTKGNTEWRYSDNSRLADETLYSLAGTMRGATITFWPDTDQNKSTFDLQSAIVNHLKDDAETYINGTPAESTFFLGAMTSDGHNYLYNRVRATIGDKVELTSQTYRNSPYTVFIRMGSTGGNQATAQDAIAVYGQWGGTNLNLSDVRGEDKEVVVGKDESGNDIKKAVPVLNVGAAD